MPTPVAEMVMDAREHGTVPGHVDHDRIPSAGNPIAVFDDAESRPAEAAPK